MAAWRAKYPPGNYNQTPQNPRLPGRVKGCQVFEFMRKSGLSLKVERWCDWRPVAAGRSVCTRYAQGETVSREQAGPELADVPAMLRRRLAPIARVVFQVLNHCADTRRQEPVVFCSVLGDINRTQALLQSIVSGAPVSPAAFSLSVHNSIGGLWSLAHDIHAPMVALAPLEYSPVPALIEAGGLLEAGSHSAVNVVYYEDDYPQHYKAFFDAPPGPTAIALRLVAPALESETSSIRIDVELDAGTGRAEPGSNFSALRELLAGDQSAIVIREPHCGWRLERYP